MEYRYMRKLGLKTSLLGFGCMRFPTTNIDGKDVIDRPLAASMIDTAIMSGVNYIDTAYPYHNGESELFLGETLKKYKRESYFLATKLPMWEVHKSEDVTRIFNEQLEKLQTDYIDFYLLHAMNRSRYDDAKELKVLEILEELRKEGKIRHIGFSFHDDYDAFEYMLTDYPWDFCQIQLNYMDVNEQAGMKGYELASKLNIPLIIMEPIKGGSLVNYADDIKKDFENYRPEYSIASWALRWLGSLPNISVILSGMSTPENVVDNLSTFEHFEFLSNAEYEFLDKMIAKIKSRVNNGCTGCRYCVPCPKGVDIPRNFAVWNNYGMYNNPNDVNWAYHGDMKSNKSSADNCVGCGLCESKCPQKLPIREHLAALHEEFEKLK